MVTLFPDRGDRYADSIYDDGFLTQHGFMNVSADPQPLTIRYGVDVAKRWSRAALPHDGSVPYYAAGTPRSS